MLKVSEAYTTPHGLSVEGTVWRWLGLQIDARGTMSVVLAAYPNREIAERARFCLPGESSRGDPELPPLAEVQMTVVGADFRGIIATVVQGRSLGDEIDNAIYSHAQLRVPLFASATRV